MPFMVKVEANDLNELKEKLMAHLDLLGQEAPVEEADTAVEPTVVEVVSQPETQTEPAAAPTREDVGNKVKILIQKRGRADIAGILATYQAQRVSDLDVKHYGDVISAIDALLAEHTDEVAA